MAALSATPISLIVGGHVNVYETYYRQVDPLSSGRIGAADAAAFLKRSGLKETVLHKIWELSDPTGKGFLDKQGFFVGLKLIALAQNGKEVSTTNIAMSIPPPNMGGTGRATPPVVGSPAIDVPWSVTPAEKNKYDGIFDTLQPVNGLLSGEKCKPVFMNSNLPVDILSRVWDLSDIDKDGFLDRDEFAVAMHLVYKALDNQLPPSSVPSALIPPSKRKKTGLAGSVAVLPSLPAPTGSIRRATPTPPGSTGSPSPTMSPQLSVKNIQSKPAATWVVTAQDKANADNIFKRLDTDNDGLVTGDEVRPAFMQYGAPQPILAHIWMLCDMKQIGKLNAEQFALALYLINQQAKGIEPPQVLTAEMVPPLSRPKPGADLASLIDGSLGSGNVSASSSMGDFSAIKELDIISKEIEQLGRDKMQLQQDINEKEEISRQKTKEVQDLQNELQTTSSQLKQLENQKEEAQKKLDDLDEQKQKLETTLAEVKQKCEEEEQNIKSLKSQISTQENTVKSQDDELNRLRIELNSLRQEESVLEQRVEAGKNQLETVMKSLKETQNQINQEQSKLSQIKELQCSLNNSIDKHNEVVEKVSSGTLTTVNDVDSALLEVATPTPSEVDAFSVRATAGSSPVSSLSGFSTGSGIEKADSETYEDFKEDPFKGKDPFGADTSDPFQSEDPFKGSDPFKSNGFAADPFAGDPFKDADPFASPNDNTLKRADDPFKNVDPFKASTDSTQDQTSSTDAFSSMDPFGGDLFDTKFQASGAVEGFDADPFSSQDPSPALPPKKNKPTSGIAAQPMASSVSVNSSQDPFQSSTKGSDDPFQSAFGAATVTDDGDPFGFGSDPFGSSSGKTDPFGSSSGKTDPFEGSAKPTAPALDPFSGGIDPFSSSTTTDTGSTDLFGGFADFGGANKSTPSEEAAQIAWATKESERMEKERQRKLEQQEQEDLEKALALSRSEAGMESQT